MKEIIKEIEENQEKHQLYYLYQDLLYHRKHANIELSGGQIVVPYELRPTVLALYHFRNHAGGDRLSSDVSTLYYWKNLIIEAARFAQSCLLCAEQKPDNRVRPPLGNPLSGRSFPLAEWQYDEVKGWNNSGGFKQWITCVELYTRYVVAYAIPSGESKDIGDLFEKHVIAPFGPPRVLSCDKGTNLSSESLKKKVGFYGIQVISGTRYSPWSHGSVEIFNQHIQCLVRILSEQYHMKWHRVLPLACLLLNTCNRPQLGGRSSYEALFGVKPEWHRRSPHRLTQEESMDADKYFEEQTLQRKHAHEAIKKFQEKREQRNRNIRQHPVRMPTGSLVYLRDSSTKMQKKIHPRYYRDPRLVLKEYPSVVITKTFNGVIHKDSKRNMKICRPRDAYWFSKLPVKVKSALGTELNPELWKKWQEEGILPREYTDVEQPSEPIAVRTRINDDRITERGYDFDDPPLNEDSGNDYEDLEDGIGDMDRPDTTYQEPMGEDEEAGALLLQERQPLALDNAARDRIEPLAGGEPPQTDQEPSQPQQPHTVPSTQREPMNQVVVPERPRQLPSTRFQTERRILPPRQANFTPSLSRPDQDQHQQRTRQGERVQSPQRPTTRSSVGPRYPPTRETTPLASILRRPLISNDREPYSLRTRFGGHGPPSIQRTGTPRAIRPTARDRPESTDQEELRRGTRDRKKTVQFKF